MSPTSAILQPSFTENRKPKTENRPFRSPLPAAPRRRLRQEDDALCPGPGLAGAGAGVSPDPGRRLPGGELALPRENLLGQPLTQVQGCRVYRAAVKGLTPEALGSADFVLYADIDLAYPQRGEVQGEAMLFRDRELTPDHRYYYRVAAYDQDGYLGGWSKTLSHAWGWLPRAPGELKAVPGDKIVSLSWSPVTTLQDGSPARDLAGYVIYRLSGTGPWIRVTPAPVQANNFQDVAVLNDVTYTYKVQAVRRLGEDLLASLDSPTRIAMPEKRDPPPPVTERPGGGHLPGGGTEVGGKPRPGRGRLPGLPAEHRGGEIHPAHPGVNQEALFCGWTGEAGPDVSLLRHRGGRLPPGQREPAGGDDVDNVLAVSYQLFSKSKSKNRQPVRCSR